VARFRTEGLDDLIERMAEMELTTSELADEMLIAGAEEVREAWKKSAEKHEHKDTGDMIASINYSRQVRKIGDIKEVDIYPQGKDRKGVRNAEKAFILHYGTSRISASHWVDDADEMAGPMVEERLTNIFDDWLEKHGMD
jgi:HK97 gp10 family phage protein